MGGGTVHMGTWADLKAHGQKNRVGHHGFFGGGGRSETASWR
jgi:hypothetical protein